MSASTASSKRQSDPQDGAIKETLESIIIAFILAFAFRAYVVEAFVIPTGSMAPTLLGEHHQIRCNQCGYRFNVDLSASMPGSATSNSSRSSGKREAVCPMCLFDNALPNAVPLRAGDRILVHKYVYTFTEPRRWDVVVFKNPQDPDQNFIKRLVGLPNERLAIVEGNTYFQPIGQPWRVARKTRADDNLTQADTRGEKVQRAVWQPIYHSQYIPLDGGTLSVMRSRPWQSPWRVVQGTWDLQGRRSFRHLQAELGVIRFDFISQLQGVSRYAYNQMRESAVAVEPIEDVRIAGAFEAAQRGLAVTLQTTARLDMRSEHFAGEPVQVGATISAAGEATLWAASGEQQTQLAGPMNVGAFEPGKARVIELWFVDQELSLWIDGKMVLFKLFELSLDELFERPPANHFPDVRIEVSGSPVVVHDVQLDRDINYTDDGRSVVRRTAHGSRGEPVTLLQDQFFCLGDNSPMSSDSRAWNSLDPWIETKLLPPYDQHRQLGIVPRRLMMGRAFFVYWPAVHRLRPDGPIIAPNFGDMRMIR